MSILICTAQKRHKIRYCPTGKANIPIRGRKREGRHQEIKN